MLPKHILVIDDDKISRTVCQMLLTKAGHIVEEAENAELAMQKFIQSQGKFDVIFIDYNMPGKNGALATQAFREIEKKMFSKRVIIIGITAHINPRIKSLCLSAGMDDIVSKPIKIDFLENIVNFLFNESYN